MAQGRGGQRGSKHSSFVFHPGEKQTFRAQARAHLATIVTLEPATWRLPLSYSKMLQKLLWMNSGRVTHSRGEFWSYPLTGRAENCLKIVGRKSTFT